MVVSRSSSIIVLLTGWLLTGCGGGAPDPGRTPNAPVRTGAQIFNTQCAMCHGRQGDQSLGGAKVLVNSTLTAEQMTGIVTYGKGGMMAYKDLLTAAEIQAVVEYAHALRDPK